MRYSAIPLLLLAALVCGCGKPKVADAPVTNAAAAKPVTVKVQLMEWMVMPSPATAAAGAISFDAKNTGTVTHALAIRGNGVHAKTADIAPGSADKLEVTLKAGNYELYCPVGNHADKGMTREFTVE